MQPVSIILKAFIRGNAQKYKTFRWEKSGSRPFTPATTYIRDRKAENKINKMFWQERSGVQQFKALSQMLAPQLSN